MNSNHRIYSFIFLSNLVFCVQVSFRVDMSPFPEQCEDINNCCPPSISGTFYNWEEYQILSEIGDNIWGIDLDLNAGEYHEYKFSSCQWQFEELADGDECTNTMFGFTNRIIQVPDSDIELEPVFFGSCEASNGVPFWQLVWSDEFNAPDIDMSKWSYDVGTGDWGWGNNEAQFYTNNSSNLIEPNSFIEDGKLIIQARDENYSNMSYTSARMKTKHKGDWTYGRYVIRAKMPTGTGTWPAIWMLPTDNVYGGWPYSGEIDIMEAVGFDHGNIIATAHSERYNWWNGTPPPSGELTVNDFHTEFHDYIIEWDEDFIKWYVDDTYYHTYGNNLQGSFAWPFDQDFHLILNIAIGGTWGGQQGIDDSIFPVQMEVEYVRVYEHDDNPGDPQVTFLVNMQNEQIDEAGVYISGSDEQLAGPSGILMSDLGVGNNLWTVTVPVSPGTYDYKFRNGYYDDWDSPGWEDSESLEACGYGDWNDRQFTVSNSDLILGPFCFSSCTATCNENVCSSDTLGDANQDNTLDVLDIVLIVDHILLDTEDEVVNCGDVNNDLDVNILDIVWIADTILDA